MENRIGNFIIIVTYVIFITSCSILKNGSTMNNNFEIFFGSGFDNDTVSFSIDNTIVFKNEILDTDFSTGITELQVIYNDGTLKTNKGGRIKSLSNFNSRTLNCNIIVSRHTFTYEINLKKGRYILFEKIIAGNDVQYRQFKHRPIFE